ncbi:MAG: phosphoglycerate kinase [Candidatus Saccharimonadales bacterium]
MIRKKTIKDIDMQGKIVLVRADYNVPLKDGVITDDYRIEKSLPTLQYLLDQNCKVVVCSHLGRPAGPEDTANSLKPVATRLNELLDREVWFTNDCIGDHSRQMIHDLPHGNVLLLENLRYYKEEESNDDGFAAKLAQDIDIFVQDGFGVVHRAHASTDAITRHLTSVAGLLVETEVDTITGVMENPERPLFALIGGAKISDKIDMLHRFIDIADVVAVGGAMANTFLLAEGTKIGKSLADEEDVPLAKEILAKARAKAAEGRFVFYLPQDGVVAHDIDSNQPTRIVDWGTNAIAEIESYPKFPPKESSVVGEDESILDIGPFSGAFIAGSMQLANTVIWNGAMGVTEVAALQSKTGPFSHGTELVVEAMLGQFGHKPHTVVGGGDTVGYIEHQKLTSLFGHVSTGGGASMELMSGKPLPGIEALADKE